MKFVIRIGKPGDDRHKRVRIMAQLEIRLESMLGAFADGRSLNDINFSVYPQEDNPIYVSFNYDGRTLANGNLERQFNPLNGNRSAIHFVDLRAYAGFRKKISKNGNWYTHIPLHLRSRAGYHLPAMPSDNGGPFVWRTISQDSEPGTWIAAVQHWNNDSNNTPDRDLNNQDEQNSIRNLALHLHIPINDISVNNLQQQEEMLGENLSSISPRQQNNLYEHLKDTNSVDGIENQSSQEEQLNLQDQNDTNFDDNFTDEQTRKGWILAYEAHEKSYLKARAQKWLAMNKHQARPGQSGFNDPYNPNHQIFFGPVDRGD